MSNTYSLACRDCKKHLWVAQKGGGQGIFYSGMPKIMEALRDFLFDHTGHNLLFGDNCNNDEIGDMMEEIEPKLRICHHLIGCKNCIVVKDAERNCHGEILTPLIWECCECGTQQDQAHRSGSRGKISQGG